MITVAVEPSSPGRFRALVDGRVIVSSSRQPFLDAARVLLAEGTPGDTRIVMRHAGQEVDALMSTVEAASKLAVGERSRGPALRFETYRAFDPEDLGDGETI